MFGVKYRLGAPNAAGRRFPLKILEEKHIPTILNIS